MRQVLEKILPWSVIDAYKSYKNKHKAASIRKQWELEGKPVPPPHIIKQQAIQHYQKISGYTTLVETGTYKGDMILAQKDNFKKIYSIELSEALYRRVKKRFQRHDFITLLQGDSGEVILEVLKELREPAIFWLDGHYSGGVTAKTDKDSPIIEELQHINGLNSLQHIILIDDARGFNGEHGYPTMAEMKQLTQKSFPGYHFSVDEDIIRMVPGKYAENK